jgi:DNA replication protein DnaC
MPATANVPLLLKQLKLASMGRHWEGLLQQSRDRGWDAGQYLAALCEQELADRDSRRIARYAKESRLPTGKTLATFDFSQVPTLSAGQIEALSTTTDWTRQARNVLLFGASGVGKTHLAAAIGHGLVEQSVRVRYLTTTALVQELQQARTLLRLEDALQKLDKYRVLILDDFGYVKKSEQETHVLFELIAHRYETGSLIVTSNQPFADWDRIFPDAMMTVAAVDRIIHHATIIQITSDSYRRKEALRQLDDTPATTTPASVRTTRAAASAAGKTTTPGRTAATVPQADAIPAR